MSDKNFAKMLSQYNIKDLSVEFEGASLVYNWYPDLKVYCPIIETQLYAYLHQESNLLKDNEERLFYFQNMHKFVFFVINSKYIFQFSYPKRSIFEYCTISVFDNKFHSLFYFTKELGNYILRMDTNESTFISTIFKNNRHKLQFGQKNFLFNVKNNKLNIQTNSPKLKSICKVDNNIEVKFKKTLYESMILDSNFNILEMSLNNKLKKQFNSNKNISNINSYEDIKNKIKKEFEEIINYNQIMYDNKIELKLTKKSFNNDILYIKKLYSMNEDIIKNNSLLEKLALTIHKQFKIFDIFYSFQLEMDMVNEDHVENEFYGIPSYILKNYNFKYTSYSTNEHITYLINKYKLFLFINSYFISNTKIINNEFCDNIFLITKTIKELFEFRKSINDFK